MAAANFVLTITMDVNTHAGAIPEISPLAFTLSVDEESVLLHRLPQGVRIEQVNGLRLSLRIGPQVSFVYDPALVHDERFDPGNAILGRLGGWFGAAHVVAFSGGLHHQAADEARAINLGLGPIETVLPAGELMKR